ncbi:hypothetical protein [Acidovorax sp. BL-A-41-H1]|uniref:hypothetical protein n=1 Tax=Acidovorax sp. BL-A-41-H1 TaxID=3421102 RepID=UPI003F79DB67
MLASLVGASTFASIPVAHAQQAPSGMGMVRNFPEAALRGALTVTSANEARLNGQPIRMAPGMRLFSPQNTLVMSHSVVGQTFKVNYVIEQSTGMLHTAWILTQGEADAPRKSPGEVVDRNYRTDSDLIKK